MKQIVRLVSFFVGVLFFFGCSSYKAKKQEALLSFPELGTLIKTKGGTWYDAAQQVGVPDWSVLKVGVQQLPFNKVSYVKYAEHIQRAGKINSISYNDSLPYKPKYLRLHLLDKLQITALLNTEANEEFRSFVSNDDSYKLVTALDLALTEAEIPTFTMAEAVQLQKDRYGSIVLRVIGEAHEKQYFLSELQVFGYQYDSFCWGEDRYHNLIIENLVSEGEKCPKGTYVKASKVDGDRAYLKF